MPVIERAASRFVLKNRRRSWTTKRLRKK